jgi:hypothetical protein
VQLEDLLEVVPRADDPAADIEPAEHGLEDRQLPVVLGGQSDAYEASAPARATDACSNADGVPAVEIAALAPPRLWIAATGSSWAALPVCSAPIARSPAAPG